MLAVDVTDPEENLQGKWIFIELTNKMAAHQALHQYVIQLLETTWIFSVRFRSSENE